MNLVKLNTAFEKKKVDCYFAGFCSCLGEEMGLGIVIKVNGEIFSTYNDFVRQHPTNTCNVAEYGALRWLLQILIKEELTQENITIYGNSMMTIRQIEGRWKIKFGYYVQYANDCKSMLHLFKNIKFFWIPYSQNIYANNLSKDNLLANGVEFKLQPVV